MLVGVVWVLLALPLVSSTYLRARLQGSNWCDGDCLTDFERGYLQEHKVELAPGLAMLRSPECVKDAQLIVSAGYYRSGSTLLYNIARLWLELAFPGTFATGYMCGGHEHQFHNVTVLCKEHGMEPNIATKADVLLMSRRTVWESISTRLEAIRKLEEPSFVDVVEQCKVLMQQQKWPYAFWRARGLRVGHDMLLSDFYDHPEREIEAVAAGLGICEAARKDAALKRFAREMAMQLHENHGEATTITQMHQPQDQATKQRVRAKIEEFIQGDPRCALWAANDASPKANSWLRRKADPQAERLLQVDTRAK